MTNFMDMMKQAKQLQGKMQDMQAQLDELVVEGTSGAGMVTVRINGKGIMQGLTIAPELLKPDEAEILEDLIIAAHNDAKAKAEIKLQEKMKKLTGGMELPPGMNPF